ncbi:hypothetical protein GCM10010207_27780 [Streptomyces atratus]|nr:hypothetical protein GCM10010207_27780 [Streptomyces atratus]
MRAIDSREPEVTGRRTLRRMTHADDDPARARLQSRERTLRRRFRAATPVEARVGDGPGVRGARMSGCPTTNSPPCRGGRGRGRGVYFMDPAGHAMELITVPYGGWPS